MDIYASDDEKGEEIKQWWRDNGRIVIISIVLGTAAIFSGRYWVSYQTTIAVQASQSYQQLSTLLTEDNKLEAQQKTQQLLTEFLSTPYSVFAAFDMATKAVELNDNDSAKTNLQWIIDHAELAGQKALAQLRLSQLLLAESKFDLAYELVNEETSISFSSLYSEMQGDILVAQAKPQQARSAYQTAMVTLQQGHPRLRNLQLKLADVVLPQ
jgi:predicted negative regulator of RcsB-dependent stress response